MFTSAGIKARVITTVNGKSSRVEFGPEADLIAEMAKLGYAFEKFNRNPNNRAELQGMPKFEGLYGPMWDGDAIRYEDPETYRICSM